MIKPLQKIFITVIALSFSGQSFSQCTTFTSTDVPKAISTSASGIVNSTISVPTSGTITDVNVKNLIGSHSYIKDLRIILESPTGTQVVLFNELCDNEDNFNLSLDDAAASGNFPCPPIGGGTYQPEEQLSAFDGEDPQGTWTLMVEDLQDPEGGSLTGWQLEICASAMGVVNASLKNNISFYPNPSNGSINFDVNSLNSNYFEVKILNSNNSVVYNKKVTDFNGNYNEMIDVSLLSEGVYCVLVSTDNGMFTDKVVIIK